MNLKEKRWAFIGEAINGMPAGLVRAISNTGYLYEGMMNEDGVNGWGYRYYSNVLCIGYHEYTLTSSKIAGKYFYCKKSYQTWSIEEKSGKGQAPKDFKLEDFIENGFN